ncbi:MAG: hypothetical protein IID16_10310 [Candidatus Marinimicrobia bacterium]|nr:hypothetical protein [Candidatus Neomarinimicrobiota bacterium]
MTTDVTIHVLLILSIRSLLLKNFIVEWKLFYPREFTLRKVGTTEQFFRFPGAAAMSLPAPDQSGSDRRSRFIFYLHDFYLPRAAGHSSAPSLTFPNRYEAT